MYCQPATGDDLIGVFGATGFLGRCLVRHLAALDRDVLAVARSVPSSFDDLPGVTMVAADFRDPNAMRDLLKGIDTVVQLVGTSTPAMGNARLVEDFTQNVLPHAAFLDECVRAGVDRVIFASSGGTVYGPVPSDSPPITEESPTNPICSHGLTKLSVEKLLGLHRHVDGLDYVTLRIANPFGPGQVLRLGQGLVPALLDAYRAGQPVTIIGDGCTARDYVYIDDVIAALIAAIDISGHPALTVNVGTGRATPVLEIIETIESLADIRFRRQYAPARDSDVPLNYLDWRRAWDELKWSPLTDLEHGLKLTLAHHGFI